LRSLAIVRLTRYFVAKSFSAIARGVAFAEFVFAGRLFFVWTAALFWTALPWTETNRLTPLWKPSWQPS
jgi:hypothetical protein